MLAEWAWLELTEGWHSWGETAADVAASHLGTVPEAAAMGVPAEAGA